jgi:hypothetical protein
LHDHVAVSDGHVRNYCGGRGFPAQHQGEAVRSATGDAGCSVRRSCDCLNRCLAIVAPSGDRSGKRERVDRSAPSEASRRRSMRGRKLAMQAVVTPTAREGAGRAVGSSACTHAQTPGSTAASASQLPSRREDPCAWRRIPGPAPALMRECDVAFVSKRGIISAAKFWS